MAQENNVVPLCQIVKASDLWALFHLELKPIPLYKDGTPAIKWRLVYGNPWTNEEFQRQVCNRIFEGNGQIYGIASTFGLSHIVDKQKHPLYLHPLDIDTTAIYELLDGLLDPETKQPRSAIKWLLENTYCTKTHKVNGLHCYWLSHHQHPAIRTEDMLDAESSSFEIKSTSASGLATLAPSPHRSYPEFRYAAVGRKDKILVDSSLYGRFLALF